MEKILSVKCKVCVFEAEINSISTLKKTGSMVMVEEDWLH